jgi:hypothetical protein
MATLREKIACERETKALLEREGLPPPDSVEYGYTCIRLFWNEPKVCVVVDIDDPPDDEEEAAA